MKDYIIIANQVSKLFSSNDIYTLTGLYFTAHSDYTTNATFSQLQKLTGQSEDYIKKGFIKRLKEAQFCNIKTYFESGVKKRNCYTLPKPTKNFKIVRKEIFDDTNLTSEEKGFIISLYCNCVNDTFNIGLSAKEILGRLKVSKSAFYKLRNSLIEKGYMKKIEDMPKFIRSADFSEDYMLTCPWLGSENYKAWIKKNNFEPDDDSGFSRLFH